MTKSMPKWLPLNLSSTGCISPGEVYLKDTLEELLEKADANGRLQYKNTDSSSKFDHTEKDKKYNIKDLISATFSINKNQYKYDNLFKPTLNIDTGNTMKDYELVDDKFRLTRYSDIEKGIDYEYTYSDDGKLVEKTTIIDGNVTSSGFLPIKTPALFIFKGKNR